MFAIKAKIEDESGASWVEEFCVNSVETAEEEINKIVKTFNESRHYECPRRRFVCLILEYDDGLFEYYLERVLRELNREANNAYGNMTVKENLNRWTRVITTFLSLHRPTKKSYINLLSILKELPKKFYDDRAIKYLNERIGIINKKLR